MKDFAGRIERRKPYWDRHAPSPTFLLVMQGITLAILLTLFMGWQS